MSAVGRPESSLPEPDFTAYRWPDQSGKYATPWETAARADTSPPVVTAAPEAATKPKSTARIEQSGAGRSGPDSGSVSGTVTASHLAADGRAVPALASRPPPG